MSITNSDKANIIHLATTKDHRCDACGKRIPIGSKYWSTITGSVREHTNCLDFEKEEVLPAGYNSNRAAKRKLK